MGMSSGLGKTLDKGTSFVLNNNKSRSIKVALVVKNLSPNAGDVGGLDSIPGLGRSPGGGHGNPLQNSCLENPIDRRVWQATVRRVTRD